MASDPDYSPPSTEPTVATESIYRPVVVRPPTPPPCNGNERSFCRFKGRLRKTQPTPRYDHIMFVENFEDPDPHPEVPEQLPDRTISLVTVEASQAAAIPNSPVRAPITNASMDIVVKSAPASAPDNVSEFKSGPVNACRTHASPAPVIASLTEHSTTSMSAYRKRANWKAKARKKKRKLAKSVHLPPQWRSV